MGKPIAKESHIDIVGDWIFVYTSTADADQTARREMPQFGSYHPKGTLGFDSHCLSVSPLYDPVEVYMYLKELFN